MKSLRDIKNKARLHLHNRMKVEALYVAAGITRVIPVSCRVHTAMDGLGLSSDMSAYKGDMPTRQLDSPRLVFLLCDLFDATIDLKKNDMIVISSEEAYKLDNADPADGITVTWNASRLTATQIQQLPHP